MQPTERPSVKKGECAGSREGALAGISTLSATSIWMDMDRSKNGCRRGVNDATSPRFKWGPKMSDTYIKGFGSNGGSVTRHFSYNQGRDNNRYLLRVPPGLLGAPNAAVGKYCKTSVQWLWLKKCSNSNLTFAHLEKERQQILT